MLVAISLVLATRVLEAHDAPSTAWAFNAVDGVAHKLMVAVGDNGLIVHFPTGETPRRVPSGTDRDLLDVNVASNDFAVAVGQGIVLLWNGDTWAPVFTEEDVVPFAQAWAFPDQGLLLYGEGHAASFRLCPRKMGAERQPFCRRFPAPLLAACGDDEITLLLANGEFYRVNNTLIGSDGSFEPAFRPQNSVELKSAWLPEIHCGSQTVLPEAFAVDSGGHLVHFEGEAWRQADVNLPGLATRQGVTNAGHSPAQSDVGLSRQLFKLQEES
jgi:hypothetical protein